MKIVDVREQTFPISSPIRNAYIDFSRMTLSVVAVITDVQRDGRPGDWLQFDCALSYGLVEYLRTLEALRGLGWSPSRCIPHGGHQLSLSIAAGLGLGGNESYPDLFQPFGGFPDGVEVEDGHVTVPDLPGIGFEGKADLIRAMRTLSD